VIILKINLERLSKSHTFKVYDYVNRNF